MQLHKVSAEKDGKNFFRFVASKAELPTQKTIVAELSGLKKSELVISEVIVPSIKVELIKFLNGFSA